MMIHFMILAILLPLRTCYTTYSQQESYVFPVMYLNISKDSDLQRLLVEWDVDKSAHDAELAISFQIQVRRNDEAATVWTKFHNVTLDKLEKPLHWTWDSDIPLECMSHAVRIRSKAEASKNLESVEFVGDCPRLPCFTRPVWFPEKSCLNKICNCFRKYDYSDFIVKHSFGAARAFSYWRHHGYRRGITGLDTSNISGLQIFPKEKTLEEGSDITLCCIGRKNQTIDKFFVCPPGDVFNHTNGQVRLLTVKNVSRNNGSNIHFYCLNEDDRHEAAFFVGKPPYTPKDFSCQTQDMRTITCTWRAGGETYLYGRNLPRYTLSETLSQKNNLCKASCSKQCSCSWDRGQQRIWNVTVTVENILGKKTATDIFDVNHRMYPTAPFQVWGESTDTEITLHWNYQNHRIELFCQTEVVQPDGKVELHNSDVASHHRRVTVRGLQPHMEYKARVRCGAAKHFWRWSEWSQPLTIRTMEGMQAVGNPVDWEDGQTELQFSVRPRGMVHSSIGKTGHMERNYTSSGGRNVALFWKQTPTFRPNGRIISYEVTWEKKEHGSKTERISIPSVYNSTRIFIDNHSYRISIMAKNKVNFSLPSVLIISRATDNSTEEFKEGKVNGTDDGIFISWEPRSMYDSYIIDWCNFPGLQPCDLQWKRFGPNTSSAVISSAPQLEPTMKKVVLTYNSVMLSWDYYFANESELGFVRGYHVYVSPIQGNCNLKGSKKHILSDDSELCKYTIENPEEKSYTVEHLMSNTKYKVAVKAFTAGGETPIVNFIYIDIPYNSNLLYLVFLLVIIPTLVAAICHWKMKWVKECCCPVIPSPNKSKVLSFKEFKIGSEKVLKISDCTPDVLATENKAEAQKLHPVTWSPLSSPPIGDKIDGHNSSWIYPSENEARDFPSTPTPHCFENFGYLSPREAESDPYQIPQTLEENKTDLAVVLYQPHYYLDIFHEDAASATRETPERKNSLRYISQTDTCCLGGRL